MVKSGYKPNFVTIRIWFPFNKVAEGHRNFWFTQAKCGKMMIFHSNLLVDQSTTMLFNAKFVVIHEDDLGDPHDFGNREISALWRTKKKKHLD